MTSVMPHMSLKFAASAAEGFVLLRCMRPFGWITMIPQNALKNILAAYDANAPLPEASTIPAPWYVDPRIAELEAGTVFSKTWQMVGRVEQVEAPGQFVTANVAGEPI